jgi:hypothetical protein
VKPLLLMAGEDDDYDWVQIHTYCKNFVQHSSSQYLTSKFLKTTGHSIHNERPSFLASTVLAFSPTSNDQSSDKPPKGGVTCTPPQVKNTVGECVNPPQPTCINGTVVDGKCIPKGGHPQ